MPDQYERLTAELNDYLDYCIYEAERAGAVHVEQHLHLGPNVIRDMLIDENHVVILDSSQMRCEYGGFGSCGSTVSAVLITP